MNAAEKMLRQNKKSKRGLPNLGKLGDVADYLLDPSAAASGGFTSGSETEVDTDAEVEVLETNTRKVLNKKQMAALRSSNRDGKPPLRAQPNVEKRAVKLIELGPRMKLRMTKVEEGVCEGKVMWHESIEKTAEEIKEMEKIVSAFPSAFLFEFHPGSPRRCGTIITLCFSPSATVLWDLEN